MTFIAATFGAPETDPGGNAARTRAPSPTPSRTTPLTSETKCQTPVCGRASPRASTRIEPGTQTRPRSLRTRSTIITFSARSFSERSSPSRSAAAEAGSTGRGRVPLIGALRTRRPWRSRNSSGERLATAPDGSEMYAARSGRRRDTARAKRSSGSPLRRDSKRVQMLAWNRSPAWIRSRHAPTASAWPTAPGFARHCSAENGRGGGGLAARASSTRRRVRNASSREGVESASNHHCPSLSRRSRWS